MIRYALDKTKTTTEELAFLARKAKEFEESTCGQHEDNGEAITLGAFYNGKEPNFLPFLRQVLYFEPSLQDVIKEGIKDGKLQESSISYKEEDFEHEFKNAIKDLFITGGKDYDVNPLSPEQIEQIKALSGVPQDVEFDKTLFED